ncbi:MAG: Rrf2 family transcriptional regulator [Cetobacterium sp.]
MEYGYVILKKLKLTVNGKIKLGKEILEDTKVPYNMGLSILTELSNAGLILSVKGKNGGFFLAKENFFLDLFIALEANQKNIALLLGNEKNENKEYNKKIQIIGNVFLMN